MKKEVAEMWVAALRSGKYGQTKSRLRCGNSFCCLGVLCDIFGIGKWSEGNYVCDNDWASWYLPLDVRNWAGIVDRNPSTKTPYGNYTLSHLNDDGKSFNDIADFIEEYWETI